MRKSDKKLDNQIRLFLTQLCENSLKDYAGFNYITHTANFNDFPKSLKIICVFTDQHSITQFQQAGGQSQIELQIQAKLLQLGLNTKGIKNLLACTVKA